MDLLVLTGALIFFLPLSFKVSIDIRGLNHSRVVVAFLYPLLSSMLCYLD
jgi:hypothetical protein